MIIDNWEKLEDYLAIKYNFKKTIRSGGLFGDCDLIRNIENYKIVIEAKYSKNYKNKVNFNINDFNKALIQAKADILILVYGGPKNALFFIYTQNEYILNYLKTECIEYDFFKSIKNHKFELDIESKLLIILDLKINIACFNEYYFSKFIDWIENNAKTFANI